MRALQIVPDADAPAPGFPGDPVGCGPTRPPPPAHRSRLLSAWGATLVKIIGVVFAIALARRPGWPLPRRPLLILGWLGAAVLTVYGALNMIGAPLALTSSIDVGPDNDRYALSWHLGLWDPLFLVWGILLGIAVRHFGRRTRIR